MIGPPVKGIHRDKDISTWPGYYRVTQKLLMILRDTGFSEYHIGSLYLRNSWYTMMTSSNGNIFRVTSHLCGEFTGPRWIPRTKASDAELWCFCLICVRINGWLNNREAGYLRRYRAHYDVTVMNLCRRWRYLTKFSQSKRVSMAIILRATSKKYTSIGILWTRPCLNINPFPCITIPIIRIKGFLWNTMLYISSTSVWIDLKEAQHFMYSKLWWIWF